MGCSSSQVEAPRQDRLATPIVHDDGIATVQREPGDPANFPAPAPGIALDPLMQHCPANLSPEDEENEEEGEEPVWAELVASLQSEDPEQLLPTVTHFQKLLSIERSPPIEELINEAVPSLSCFVQAVIEANIIPSLVLLLATAVTQGCPDPLSDLLNDAGIAVLLVEGIAHATLVMQLLADAADLDAGFDDLESWRKLGGSDIEPVLASGAVALLDARWIITHAEAGGTLQHRQALPKEAFLSLADLVKATGDKAPFGKNALPVASLSYPWLTKDHPDPRGDNLRRVAKALKVLTCHGKSYESQLGVFWDFGSLHQHPDPANGIMRTEAENGLFKQGLDCLGTLYSHQYTAVLRLTTFPEGHKTEDQPEGNNLAAYFDRGWCASENAWASLTKSSALSLDLGLMCDGKEYDSNGKHVDAIGNSLIADCTKDGGRRPPMLPPAFAAELEMKSFTNGKDDKPLVKRLYKAAFEEQFGKATNLMYSNLGWGDAVAEIIASGAAPRLERLYLHRNKIGDGGCKALAAALSKEGAAPRLKTLSLGCNQIGGEGDLSLAAALKDGAAASLKAKAPAPLNTHICT